MLVETPSFTPDRLDRITRMERNHFWFAARRRLVERLLRRSAVLPGLAVLDLGVGGGLFCQQLAQAGHHMTAIDFLPTGLLRLHRDAPTVKLVQSSAESLGLRASCFDAALALDVLEHIDDQAATAELFRVLRPGGLLIITVPAFPALWSFRDTAAGHRRRYRRQSLVQLLSTAGFSVEHTGYYQCLLFPLAILSRWVGRRSAATRDFEDTPPELLNALFHAVSSAEVLLGGFIPWPYGSSLFAVARRPPEIRI